MKWIPVAERMPEIKIEKWGYGHVVVIATDGNVVRPLIYEAATIRGKRQYRWKWMWDALYRSDDIIAWMPLPEPPEMDGGMRK